MTPEFRQNIYQYLHDERKIAMKDSIPYQLQKLFVLLEQKQHNVQTKGLLKSFQWNEVDSFQQHDVQEFCRILFEAIEKASKANNWIEKLYSGVMESFISCGSHPRANQEVFMDISLPIRSQFTSTYYRSIEECLKEYLKPENLDDKIECEGCGGKVNVEKGLRLNTLPPILTLQINRFELNYETFQREKVNSFLYFPEVLELSRFLMPYDQIKIKGIPENFFDKVKYVEKKKSERQTDFYGLGVVGSGIKKKKSFEEQAEKKHTKFYDEENKDKREDEIKKLSPEEEKIKNLQILNDLKADKEKLDQKTTKLTNDKGNKEEKANVEPSTQSQVSNSLKDDMLFGEFMDGFDISGKAVFTNEFDNIEVSNEIGSKVPRFEKTEVIFDHEEESFDPTKEYPDHTYILYSILVHSGGAYGGHYYAYIFNGLEWFCFNDNSVKKVSKQEIRKYGHPTEETSSGANAYLLFYREANCFKNILKEEVVIPEELAEKIKNDKSIYEATPRHYEESKNRLHQIENSLIIKLKYKEEELHTLVVPNRQEQTIADVKEMIKNELNIITEDNENWRLRRFDKNEGTMHEIYDGEIEKKTLEKIGLRETCYMAIEVKEKGSEFEMYDPKAFAVKLNVWREGITLLTETYLKPIKVLVREENTFCEFYQKIEATLNMKNPLVLKRNFSVGNPYQIFDPLSNKDKTLISLRFFNGINLYVEEQSNGKVKWEKEFEDEKYKCQIKFNNPSHGIDKKEEIFFDTRKTLGELKEKVSQIINVHPHEFRLKKSQQSVSEMTNYKKRLTDLRFVTVEYLHIELGKSSKGTVIIRKGKVSLIDEQIEYDLGEEFQMEIDNLNSTVAELKLRIGEKYGISEFNLRVREIKAHQFGEIFKDGESLLKIREKSLVWEELDVEDPKGTQIYLRVFNILSLELGPLLEVFVEQNGSYEELAFIIEEETQIKSNKILAYKSISNFIDKSLLFDCEWIEVRYLSKTIREEPLCIAQDGDIIIVKEGEVEYEAKESGRKVYEKADKNLASKKEKEASLRITVVEEKETVAEMPKLESENEEVNLQEKTTN